MIRIEVTQGPLQGKTFTFGEHDLFLFGRDEDTCHITHQDDPFVSRHHFLLEVNVSQARLCDLGSRNGTYVNGRQHGGRSFWADSEDQKGLHRPTFDLSNGDMITAGKTTLQIFFDKKPIQETVTFDPPPTDDPPTLTTGESDTRRTIVESPQVAEARRLAGRHTILEPAESEKPPAISNARSTIVEGSPESFAERIARGEAAAAGRQTMVEGIGSDSLPGSEGTSSESAKTENSSADPPRVDGYQLDRQIGQGQHGPVYLARRAIDGSQVAIKFLKSEINVTPQLRADFLQSASLACRLRHRNITRVYSAGCQGNNFYFVSSFCESGSLVELFRSKAKSIRPKHFAHALCLLLDALSTAHEKGLVHRSICPENVLVSKKRGQYVPRLADFGFSKLFESKGFSGLSITSPRQKNHAFMPREVVTNFQNMDPASDVFSLAAVFYLMIAGRPPRNHEPGRNPLATILNANAVPLRRRCPDFHSGLADILDRALQEDVQARYANGREMHSAVVELMRNEGWSTANA